MKHFTLNGVSSKVFDIVADRETHSVLPAQRKYQKEIPMLDGVVDFGIGGYQTRIITFDIYYEGVFSELRKSIDALAAWLTDPAGGYKQLAFEDAPGRYYKAKLTSDVTLRNSMDRKIGALQFECNPPWVYEDGIELNPEQVAWTTAALDGTQYIQTFSATGNMRFTLTGTLDVAPIIKLYGRIPPGLTLTHGAKYWSLMTAIPWDCVVIDCGNETVTRMSDGYNLLPSVFPGSEFFQLSPGNIQINISGAIQPFPSNLTVAVELLPGIGV